MATKAEKSLAYEAGRVAITEPPERRSPEACPFPPGSEERTEWLRGLIGALDEQPDPAELRRALKEAQ